MSEWSWEDIRRLIDLWSAGDDAGGKRRRIVEAATDLFIRQGYRKTSVDEIARRAQVAKGTIYLYFDKKPDLLIATVTEEKRRYMSRVKPVFDPELAPVERLRRYLFLMLTLAAEMPLTSRLLSGDRELMIVLEEMDPDFREQMLELQSDFVGSLLDGASGGRLRPEDLRDRARALLALMTSGAFFVDDTARMGMPLESFASILTDWLVAGVAGTAPIHGARKATEVSQDGQD